ncbi:MAG: methyltransferase domain-containing protein [Desulfovibrio sp.]
MQYHTIFLARPLSPGDPIFARDDDGYLFPRILRAYVEHGLMDAPVLSMPDIVPDEHRRIIEEWGFECSYSKSDLPQRRLSESTNQRIAPFYLVLTPYALLLDADAVAREVADFQKNSFEAVEYPGACTAHHFLLCTKKAVEMVAGKTEKAITPFLLVSHLTGTPLAGKVRKDDRCQAALQSLLFKLLYRNDDNSLSQDCISAYFRQTPSGELFRTESYNTYLKEHFGINGYAKLSKYLQRDLGDFTLDYVARQIRNFQYLLPFLPAQKREFVEVGFGRCPVTAMLMTNLFDNGHAVEPFFEYSVPYELITYLSRALGALDGVGLETSSSEQRINSRLHLHPGLLEDTEIESDSVDFLYSKTVLEHVAEVESLSRECYRILRHGGRMLHVIDHTDHSGNISFGLLCHEKSVRNKDGSEAMSAHHNLFNLWRVNDFIALWEQLGFQVTVVKKLVRVVPPESLHSCWKDYAEEDLYCYTSILLAEKV